MDDQVDAALGVLDRCLPAGTLLGVYLHGSAVAAGLRPDSDLDLAAVAARRLSTAEKRCVVAGLLPISGAETRLPSWRPIELTIVARPDLLPWRYPPPLELQYGEWLRDRLVLGDLGAWPSASPDLAILVHALRAAARPLVGPPVEELLDPVPQVDLVRATLDELPSLLADLESDTRNVLLTLARMWCTLETGEIRPKDAAADWAIDRLPEADGRVLAEARALYLAGGWGEWPDGAAVAHTAAALAERVERAAS